MLGIALSDGIYLEFDLAAKQEQSLKSLESDSRGIELVAAYEIKRPPNRILIRATVYVPRGQLAYFEKKVTKYLSEDTESGQPKNEPLIASIEDIRLATLQSLWTDAEIELPPLGKPLWWEVWLRKSDLAALEQFRNDAQQLGLRIGEAVAGVAGAPASSGGSARSCD